MADATLRIDVDTREATRALGTFQRSLAALATGAVASTFVRLTDQAIELSNRLNQVSNSTQQQTILFGRLIGIANDARTPLSTTGDLFFRIARNVDALGISQTQALLATELVAKAISSSGISAAEASGPLLQLGQALASGRLQGDELRSILEGLPPVAKAIADSLGVPIGELRRLGSEGKISSQQVIQAILAARDTIERDFGKTVPTIAQSFQRVTNSVTALFAQINQNQNVSGKFATAINYIVDAINWLGKNIETIITVLEILGTVFIAGKIIQGVKILSAAFISFGNQIKSIGYIFTDFAAGVTGVFKYVVQFWRSATTTMSKHAKEFGEGISFYWKGVFVYLGTIVKSLGSILLNLAGPIVLITGFFTDFFDRAIAGAGNLLSKLPLIGNIFNKQSETIKKGSQAEVRAIDNAIIAMEQKGKGIDSISDKQRQFNKEFEKTVAQQEYELMLKQNSNLYTESQMTAMLEVNKQVQNAISQEARLTEQQAIRLRNVIEEAAAYERMAQSRRQVEEAGRSVITQVAQTADPRIAAEQEYINQKIALENYFVQNSLMTQQQYQETLFQIEEQYRIAKYDASVALEERLRSVQQKTFEMQLRNQGFSMDQARKMGEERAAFDRKTEFEKAQFAIEQGASVFENLGKHNKTAFQAAKAFNIANAIMNTYAGATKALATYPPPFNFIAAAAVVASGLAQVATIRAQQYSGRALGGPVMAGQSYIVGERGPEMFTPSTSGGITPNNQLADMSQPLTVNFNIQANDTRGFDQLLAERRPMIVNMIRTAMEDRGNKSNL